MFDPLNVVGVADTSDVPSVGQEPGGDILGKGDVRVALDGDVIVIENPAEPVQAEMTGQRSGFRGDPLHEASVSTYRVDPVIEDRESAAVVAVGKPSFGDRHADAGCDSLA